MPSLPSWMNPRVGKCIPHAGRGTCGPWTGDYYIFAWRSGKPAAFLPLIMSLSSRAYHKKNSSVHEMECFRGWSIISGHFESGFTAGSPQKFEKKELHSVHREVNQSINRTNLNQSINRINQSIENSTFIQSINQATNPTGITKPNQSINQSTKQTIPAYLFTVSPC